MVALSIYAVNKVAWRVVRDDDFRDALSANAETALAAFSPPLTVDEQRLLREGAVGALARRGANTFLLNQLARFEMFGLSRANYRARMAAEYADEYPENFRDET